jgi:Putative Ig domain
MKFRALLYTAPAFIFGSLLHAETVKIVTPPNLPPATVGVPYKFTFQATGTTLPLSWDIDTKAAPPGFTIDDPTGVLTGMPTVTGTYNFRVHVDALSGFENSVAEDMETVTLVVSQPGSGQVMPTAITFSGIVGGENPPSKVLSVVSTSSGSSTFTFTLDSATNGSAAPAWLIAGPPQSQTTPGRIVAGVDLSKAPTTAGSYNARIRVSFVGNSTTSDIPVTLILTTAPQKLSVSPTSLRFNKANLEQTILVQNAGGGGPIGIGAGAPGSSIISSVKLSAPQTPTLIHVTVKPASPGAYHGNVSLGATQLLTGPSSAAVPVSYYVPPAGPFLAVDQTGYRFLVRQGNGTSVSKTIRVLNLGDSGTTINWKATVLAGSDFLARRDIRNRDAGTARSHPANGDNRGSRVESSQRLLRLDPNHGQCITRYSAICRSGFGR